MASVQVRKVFYISGFDPRGASHYHRLYRTHAAEQGKVNGLSFEVSGRKRLNEHSQGWEIRSRDAEGHEARVHMEFLRWDDIVRAQWATGPARMLADLIYCIRIYLLSGLIARFGRASRQQLIAALYPPVFVLLAVLLALGVGYGVYALASLALPSAMTPLAAALGVVGAAAFLKGAWMLGDRAAAFWLLRIYAFSARWAHGEVPELEQRIDTFASRIARALHAAEPDDEVLVVAHSVGTMIVVPAITRALRELDALPRGRLTLITLGQCIPLISFHPEAVRYREELQALANDERLLWVDYTARTDGACFPLLDFVAATGLETQPGRGPKLLSPRFFKLYEPPRYRRLRRDWYTMHFLYLMSTDLAGDYDFFAITAGPQSLRSRHARA